ncbi:EPIDERMAL PATTERNING FACTOR-like protein 1 [Phragmites australis]|uniref:EPIDERMAL PATTERNING FACTOR-like protein 1 n=1 Tax=Phragmites australis TaxID=29695 RepID=UPI002D79968D|nr:EPIDERMAL PATTERNING FACTOR-like protein 1 [Phragmites australis]XP_062220961.1 EPIDERMAL PATTERNING FACTOR-like protein 1 [Phragmites australis]
MAVSSPRRALLAAVLLSFLLVVATSIRTTTFSSSQNLVEDKSRLGSTPPSCHNRCSACNPCTPVQVTTVPRSSRSARVADDVVTGFSRYSNYKPLGWKCRCDGRLYDP